MSLNFSSAFLVPNFFFFFCEREDMNMYRASTFETHVLSCHGQLKIDYLVVLNLVLDD
jgi:hypothetical protein